MPAPAAVIQSLQTNSQNSHRSSNDQSNHSSRPKVSMFQTFTVLLCIISLFQMSTVRPATL